MYQFCWSLCILCRITLATVVYMVTAVDTPEEPQFTPLSTNDADNSGTERINTSNFSSIVF